MSLSYIGAGFDFNVVNFFPDTKKFIFVDTSPRNEFDDLYDIEETRFNDSRFIHYLMKESKKLNFEFISKRVLKTYSENELSNPTLYHFQSENQEVFYYVSSNFVKDNLHELSSEIGNSDGLIVSGYFPQARLFDLVRSNIKIYLMSDTYYGNYESEDETENIVNYLYENPKVFSKYAVNKETNQFTYCEKMEDVRKII
jgi:hypothetical protein